MKVVRITMKSFLYLVVFSLLISSCKKENESPIPKDLIIAIEGDAILGDTLTINLPTNINFGKVSYQWRRYSQNYLDNNYEYYDIEGATQPKYVVTPNDISFYLLVEITTSVQDNSVYSEFTKEVSCLKGRGIQSDPYKIYYIEDLAYLEAHHLLFNYFESGANYYFSLERDLDFLVDSCYKNPNSIMMDWDDNEETIKGIKETFTTGEGFVPLYVVGNFNGNNHTISNLYINNPSTAALFEEISSVKNLKLKNINVTGANAVGGLAAGPSNLKTIENCFVSGSIKTKSGSYAGGLVGVIDLFNVSSIALKGNEVVVNINDSLSSSSQYLEIGGLVGTIYLKENNSIVIENNVSKGSVSSKTYEAGGLIGRISTSNSSSAQIKNNYSSASVVGKYRTAGFIGVVSIWGGAVTVANNYSVGEVKDLESSSNCKLSGFIGIADFVRTGNLDIKNNYTISNIVGNGTASAAGIIGHLEASTDYYYFNISNCIAFNPSISGVANSNRILGTNELYNYATVKVNYFNNYANSAMTINGSTIVDSGVAPENGINGKSLAASDFGNSAFYSNSGNWNTGVGSIWDFVNIWEMSSEKERPILKSIRETP